VHAANRETDGRSVRPDYPVRRVDGNPVDVLARPGRYQRRGGLPERLLALLPTFVARHEPCQPGDHEQRERCKGADDHEQLAAPCSESRQREHRRRNEDCGREHGEPPTTQPSVRIDSRLRQADHGGMKRRSAPQDRSGHEQDVDRIAHLVPAVKRAEAVERVADELEHQGGRDHDARRGAQARTQDHSSRERHEQDVQDQERKGCTVVQCARAREQLGREERPRDDRDTGGENARVDQARPITPRKLAANHEMERSGQNHVRHEHQEVCERWEWHDSDSLRADGVDRIRGDPAHTAHRNQVPRRSRARLVEGDTDQRGDHRRNRKELEPTTVQRPVSGQSNVRDGTGRRDQKERPVRARQSHTSLSAERCSQLSANAAAVPL
jgi:hypothetical protein